MHTLLLHPTDVLFFKDGRPMDGASSGQGAAWPLPTVTDSALLACLHRANLPNTRIHHQGASASRPGAERKFGSFVHAGPFPVCTQGIAHTWFFPRPLDAAPPTADDQPTCAPAPILLPVAPSPHGPSFHNLPGPLIYPVGSEVGPSKQSVAPWWSEGAWNAYLQTAPRDPAAGRIFFKSPSDFTDSEHSYGIAIDPETQTVLEGRFYSAHYLRLRTGWRLGCLAQAPDPSFVDEPHGNDLLRAALAQAKSLLVLGGQQRTASVETVAANPAPQRLPLPVGQTGGFPQHAGKFRVKWVLLSPALWPSNDCSGHSGGWLPSWVDHQSGAVLLRQSHLERAPRESREAWRKRVAALPPIGARLVAAVVGKSIPVTGFAMAHEAAGREGGAKNTHAAVPGGSVYYFEADSAADAERLAAALNWHGADPSCSTIRNRRSNLMGEKGFGIGVCAGWDFHPAFPPHPSHAP